MRPIHLKCRKEIARTAPKVRLPLSPFRKHLHVTLACNRVQRRIEMIQPLLKLALLRSAMVCTVRVKLSPFIPFPTDPKKIWGKQGRWTAKPVMCQHPLLSHAVVKSISSVSAPEVSGESRLMTAHGELDQLSKPEAIIESGAWHQLGLLPMEDRVCRSARNWLCCYRLGEANPAVR